MKQTVDETNCLMKQTVDTIITLRNFLIVFEFRFSKVRISVFYLLAKFDI